MVEDSVDDVEFERLGDSETLLGMQNLWRVCLDEFVRGGCVVNGEEVGSLTSLEKAAMGNFFSCCRKKV